MLEENFIELNDIKNLSSETRLDILRILNGRRSTVSELSRSLDISKSAILYHILRLCEIGFVNRVDDGERKWIYYELSSKGRSVIQSKKITVGLLLSSSVLSLIAGILQVERYLESVRRIPLIKGVFMPSETVLYSGIIFIFISAMLFLATYWYLEKDKSL
ncbi:MAG: winged helix-turn-helix domain-containing protein [Candidatus Methanoperedens sp.]|nr:winged helix-turn-helix domain-containing protein [Candidatus Methanoperedens sp.]